ncbi:MAG: hypothetical protein HQL69_13570 [Magnetococcales bacterium]|nr:hypothetical protein [Magnetococcales bacterium]
MSLYSKNIESILDKYDADYDLYKSYKDRLVVVLNELFNRTTIPIRSISGTIMSRGALRNKLMAKGAIFNSLSDIHDLVSIRVVTYFHDDINLSISIISKEFIIEKIPLTPSEEAAQTHFGILMERLALILPESKYSQVEYERFSYISAELKVISAIQESWFKVKDVFDDIALKNSSTDKEINRLAQVSYLLKMADEELSRIKTSLTSNSGGRDNNESTADTGYQLEQNRDGDITTDNSSGDNSLNTAQTNQHNSIDESEEEYVKFIAELDSFILNDRVVRALDRNISDFFDTTLTYNEEFLSSLAYIYINMQLSSVSSIKVQLDDNRDVINTLMKHVFGDMSKSSPEYVYRGSSLLVLFYVLIAQTGNIEIIKRQIKDYAALDNMSADEFANDLLFYYRKSV